MNGMERFTQLMQRLYAAPESEARAVLLEAMERDRALAAGAFGVAYTSCPWDEGRALRFLWLTVDDLKQRPELRKLWRSVRTDAESTADPPMPYLWDDGQ